MRYNPMPCEFCNYSENIEPQRIVYEDEEYMAFIAKEPLTNGHCIVIPKEHSEFVSDVNDVKRFFIFISYLCQAVKDVVNSNEVKIETRYGHDNHKINHTHFHIIPVFVNDEDARAAESIKNVDERILENLRKSQWYDTLNG